MSKMEERATDSERERVSQPKYKPGLLAQTSQQSTTILVHLASSIAAIDIHETTNSEQENYSERTCTRERERERESME